MRVLILAVFLAGCVRAPREEVQETPQAGPPIQEILRPTDGAYRKLIELCDDVGHRLSGSKG
ncbi:MAG TPA: hypothetical protein VJU16_03830, partial [Planctomycetota bacterium]|nr:hypothetical protein [Planctomycetota bacterium]